MTLSSCLSQWWRLLKLVTRGRAVQTLSIACSGHRYSRQDLLLHTAGKVARFCLSVCSRCARSFMLNALDTAGQQAVEGGGLLSGRAAAQKTQQE